VALSIPVGYYSVNELVFALDAQLKNIYPTLVCTYDQTTARISIARPGGVALLFPAVASPAPVLGFDPSATQQQADAHTAPHVLNLTHRHLSFNILVNAHGIDPSTIDTVGRQSSFIVPNTEDSLGLVEYNALTSFAQCIHLRSPVREVHVALLDSEFNAVDLNGSDWMMIWARVR
jgi:hypothetical protein